MSLYGLWSSQLKFSIAVALVIGSLFGSIWMSQHTVSGLPAAEYHQQGCATGTLGLPTLTLLLVTPAAAADITASLCGAPATRRNYSYVQVSWKPRTLLSPADLINERYDVIWNRRHFLTGLMPDFEQVYDTLLHYDNYQVFWLSLQGEPVMSAEYFAGKRIGLLNDASSHTHNLLPLTSLRSLNAAAHIPVYFDDTSMLYDAFYQGKVDLISGGSSVPALVPVYRTLLDNSATAATFFVVKSLHDEAVRCEIVAALQPLESLWQNIDTHATVTGDC